MALIAHEDDDVVDTGMGDPHENDDEHDVPGLDNSRGAVAHDAADEDMPPLLWEGESD